MTDSNIFQGWTMKRAKTEDSEEFKDSYICQIQIITLNILPNYKNYKNLKITKIANILQHYKQKFLIQKHSLIL